MNLRTFALSCVVGTFCVAGAALAGDKDAAKAPAMDKAHQDMMDAYMKLATPGEYHTYLKPLEGEWKTTVKSMFQPGQMDISEGSCSTTWVMSGRYLKEDCTGTFNGSPFSGMGLTGYDNMSKKYVSTWIDTMGTGIMSSEGTIDASHKTLTFSSMMPDPATGKPAKMRMTTEIIDANKHVFSMYGMVNGKEMKQMEITYVRK